jgi:hypothetical protein
MRTRLVLGAVIATTALVAAGCGSSGSSNGSSNGSAPAAHDLAADTVSALKTQKSAHYALDATITVKGSAKSGGSAGGVLPISPSALTANPVKLHLEGDFSTDTLTAKGSAASGGQNFAGQLLLGQHAAYLNILGAWYGSKTTGLKELEKQGNVSTNITPQNTNPDTVRKQFDSAFNGSVAAGPDLDGTKTWEFSGTPNAEGLAKLAKDSGQKGITQTQIDQLKAVAPAIHVVLDVGQKDHLLRRLTMTVDLTGETLKKLATGAQGASLNGLQSLKMNLTASFSKWGEKVSFTAPASYKPLQQLLGALLGGSFGTN